MFYETFKEGIDRVEQQVSKEAAEVLALDIIYYGVRGERKENKEDVHFLHNALMLSYQPVIDKSKEHKRRAIKEAETAEWYRNNHKKRKNGFSKY